MPDSKEVFLLSTKSVDNFVENRLLTAPEAWIHAGSNKMLNWKAKKTSLKIIELENECLPKK